MDFSWNKPSSYGDTHFKKPPWRAPPRLGNHATSLACWAGRKLCLGCGKKMLMRTQKDQKDQFLLSQNRSNSGYDLDHYSRRKFRSETSDNMDSWKAEVRRVRREKIRRKKMQVREKVGTSRNTVLFQWFVAPEGRKVGSLKRRVQSQLARWEMKNCTPLWREAHLQVKMLKTPGVRTTFGSWDVEKVHAVVARSTFRSQKCKKLTVSDHFWKLRCRKSARRCGAKHISKSKCTKHTMLGPLLEVEMSKKCTPLWREAHFEVKMYKTHHARTTFGSWDVEKVHAVVARSTFRSQMCKKLTVSDHFWKLRCRKKCTPLWREAHFEVKSVKHWRSQTTFGSWDVEKVHAVVARSTFRSQKCQKLTVSDHFWKLRCRKSARRCGAKHISKSKCTKHTMLGPLLEVEMLKKCTPLWREAHFEVKSVKNWGGWAFFDVKMSKK